jgi:hypothetical protein
MGNSICVFFSLFLAIAFIFSNLRPNIDQIYGEKGNDGHGRVVKSH